MKRIFAAAALLLLAGCETFYDRPPPEGSYGDPAPAPGQAPFPYPGDEPYPGNEPYPPAPPPGAYPGGPVQPQTPECPITASREWSAWVNAMPGPGGRVPVLIVRGKVVTPTAGYQVAFDRALQVRRGQPPQAFVTLFVAPPSGGATSQAASTHEVRWEWPLNQPVGSVVVRCGDKTLAEITSIQTAY